MPVTISSGSGVLSEPKKKSGKKPPGWLKWVVVAVLALAVIGGVSGGKDDEPAPEPVVATGSVLTDMPQEIEDESRGVPESQDAVPDPDETQAQTVEPVCNVGDNWLEIRDVSLGTEDDAPAVSVTLLWVNYQDRTAKFNSSITVSVTQGGHDLSGVGDTTEAEPGEISEIVLSYKLRDYASPVTVELSKWLGDADDGIVSESFNLQDLDGYVDDVPAANVDGGYVSVTGASVSTDSSGKPAVLVNIEWTNTGMAKKTFEWSVGVKAVQDGSALSEYRDARSGHDTSVAFGDLVDVVLAYRMSDYDAPIELSAGDVTLAEFVPAELDGYADVIVPIKDAEEAARKAEEDRKAEEERKKAEEERKKAEASKPVQTTKPAQSTNPSSGNTSSSAITDFVLNTSSMKFHRTNCSYLPTDNRLDSHGKTAEQLISEGYSPCKRCNPN